jgi:aspartate kinase
MKQHIQILKFGGTSVGDGQSIRRVANIIAHTRNDVTEPFPVVVVSALSKVTDQLLRIAHYASEGNDDAYKHELAGLRRRHLDAVEEAVHNSDGRTALRQQLDEAFMALEGEVTHPHRRVGARPITCLPDRVPTLAGCGPYIDAVIAWGERLSALLVAAACNDVGVRAVPVREEVIVTDQPRYNASLAPEAVVGAEPLWKETRVSVQAHLSPYIEQHVVPIVAGFIGRTQSGQVTTLGRNGSDYSASVIGAALDCAAVTIYTDVDGILTADPRVVKNARLLPQLSYEEAAQLSWFGAKVLHPRTLIPLVDRGIPVRVRNTFRPRLRGTLVSPQNVHHSAAGAITVRRHLALITVQSVALFGVLENAGQVFAVATHVGTPPIAVCSTSGQHLSFVVEEQGIETLVEALQHDRADWKVHVQGGLAACACIGSGFTLDPMSPARAIAALARERIPIISQGASASGMTLIVEDRDSEHALRCLHRDMIAPAIPLVRSTA